MKREKTTGLDSHMIDAWLLRKHLGQEPFAFERSYIALHGLHLRNVDFNFKDEKMQIPRKRLKIIRLKRSEVQIRRS